MARRHLEEKKMSIGGGTENMTGLTGRLENDENSDATTTDGGREARQWRGSTVVKRPKEGGVSEEEGEEHR